MSVMTTEGGKKGDAIDRIEALIGGMSGVINDGKLALNLVSMKMVDFLNAMILAEFGGGGT